MPILGNFCHIFAHKRMFLSKKCGFFALNPNNSCVPASLCAPALLQNVNYSFVTAWTLVLYYYCGVCFVPHCLVSCFNGFRAGYTAAFSYCCNAHSNNLLLAQFILGTVGLPSCCFTMFFQSIFITPFFYYIIEFCGSLGFLGLE